MNNEEKILGMLEMLTEKVDCIDRRMDRMEQRIDRVEADVSGIKVHLDVDVQRQPNLLSEGHARVVERLDTLEELAEETRDKVDVIYAVVKRHSGEIAELKKTQ